MTDEQRADGDGMDQGGDRAGSGSDGEQRRNARERVSDGVSRALNALSALKDAIEETLSEARERGDVSMDKAREAMRDAVDRARDATSEARERFDFVSQAEWESLVRRVEAIEARLGLDGKPGAGEDAEGD